MTKGYDQKTRDIMKELSKGKTRQEVAQLFNYKSLRGMESYMARRGLKYHKKSGNYINLDRIKELEEREDQLESSKLPLKVKRIVKKLEKSDPRTVAKEEGLGDEIGLGRYMKKHKLYWSSRENAYLYSQELIVEEEKVEEMYIEEDYREILAYISENMERLRQVLNPPAPQDLTISIRLEKDLEQALKDQATQEGLNPKEILKKALKKYLEI